MKNKFMFNFRIVVVVMFISTNILRAQVSEPNIGTSQDAYFPNFIQMPYIKWMPETEYADSSRRFQGIPSLEIAPGGRLWATWFGGGADEGPENYVVLVTSGDGGKIWSGIQMVIDPPYRASEPCLWVDPSGKMWLMWNQYPFGLRSEGSQLWAMTTVNPDAEKPKWSEPRLIAQELNNFNKPTVLEDGTWLLPAGTWYFGEKDEENILSRPILSVDEGKTFHAAGEIPIIKNSRNFEEYQVIEKRDGTLWLLTRTNYGIGESFSTNKGKTWSEVIPSKIVNTVSRFFITRLKSGKLLLIKNGPIDQNVGRSQMMAFLSDDDGATFYGGLMIDERNDVSYPDGVQTSNGMIYIIYDHGRYTDKEILMSAFTETDVAMGKITSQNTMFKVLINKARELNPKFQPPSDNQDGFPLSSGRTVSLQLKTEKVNINTGEIVFTNNGLKWDQVPDRLKGKNFIRMNNAGGPVKIKQTGILYVATPLCMRTHQSTEKSLVKQGFVKTDIPEFILVNDPAYVYSVFQKKVETGETINIDKLGILIY